MTWDRDDQVLSGAAEGALLNEIRIAGASFQRVVFTRNRRVMVSTGDAGTTLRLNERFRQAPPAVLQAIGRLLVRPRTRAAAAARSLLAEYLRQNPPASISRAPRPRLSRPGDPGHTERLRAEFDRVNSLYFEGELPRVAIHLSDRMRRRNGHFSAHPEEIVISRRLCSEAADGEAERTLRHEMIHLWQHVTGRKPGHGDDFRSWARRLDIHPRATRTVCWPGERV